MSGGHFDYAQGHIYPEIIDRIDHLLCDNEYPDDIIEEFKRSLYFLKRAYVYAQRIDWLVSGDDGEDSFRSRLKSDLEELDNQKE